MKYILSLLAALIALPSWACTSFLVGKKASTDGSTFITYNADSYGMYGSMRFLPGGSHPKGTMRTIIDGDSNKYLGEIPEAPVTYTVIGQINEYQVSITETTFGGRAELDGKYEGIDYVSLMTLGLQRSRTAREAIQVMTSLVEKYGYASEGESFSIADPNEIWIMEMIGKGPGRKGAVWVAIRIPDDCIAAHANQSRIHKFNLKDKDNVIAARDVISFARKQGYFSGKDEEFSFADAYSPADFSALRFCEARAWSFYNKWVDGMEKYLPAVDGRHIGQTEPMPLYFKPKRKLSLEDLMASNRDHYEGTPFDVTKDAGAGIGEMPYRPTPLTWECDGKKYFNERPISTQQSAFTVICQMRAHLPNAIGGILWWGNDDPNMIAYTPVYCQNTSIPLCYNDPEADAVTFSWNSAFWVCNWVANMTYPRYNQLFPALEKQRNALEKKFIQDTKNVEAEAQTLLSSDPAAARQRLTEFSNESARYMMRKWRDLGQYMIVKFNDMTVKPEDADGQFSRTPDGIGANPTRPGYTDEYKRVIIRETGEKYRMPE